jgi:hypothetical protein
MSKKIATAWTFTSTKRESTMKASKPIIHTVNGADQFLPYHLPPGGRGKFYIKTETEKKGTSLAVVSMRNSIFMGMPPQKMTLHSDTIVHSLGETDRETDRGTWMTTSPQEVEQHQRQLGGFHGNVLLGGLGLGLAPAILAQKPGVTSITIIEKSTGVRRLVEPHLRPFVEGHGKELHIITSDIFEWLRRWKLRTTTKPFPKDHRFDFAFYDTWCPTGEMELVRSVIPLRRLSRGILPNSHIQCLNEDEMLGQVRLGMQSQLPYIGHEGGLLSGSEQAKKFLDDPKSMKGRADVPWLRCVSGLCKGATPPPPMMEAILKSALSYIEALRDPELYDENWRKLEPQQNNHALPWVSGFRKDAGGLCFPLS